MIELDEQQTKPKPKPRTDEEMFGEAPSQAPTKAPSQRPAPRSDAEMMRTPQVTPQVTKQVKTTGVVKGVLPTEHRMSEDEFDKVSQLPETDPRFIALQKAMKKSVDTGDTDESDYDNWLAKKRKLNFDYERAKKVEQQRDTENLKSLQDAEAGDAETQVLAEKLKKKRSRILNNLLSESTLDNAKSGIKEVPDNKDPYDEVGLNAVSETKNINDAIQGYLNKFQLGDDGNVVTGWRKAPKSNADAIVERIFGEDKNPLSNIQPILDEKGNIKDFGGELVLDLTDTKDLSGKAFGTAVLGKVLPNLTADEDVQKAVQEAIDPNSKFGSLDEEGKYVKPYYDIVDAYQTNPSNYATHNGKIYGSYNVSSSLVNWVLSAKALKEEGKLTPEALREAMPKVEKIISDYNEQSDQFVKRQEMVNEGKTDYTLSDSLSTIFNQFRAFSDNNNPIGKVFNTHDLGFKLTEALGLKSPLDKGFSEKKFNRGIADLASQADTYQSVKESSILQKNAEKFGSNMIWNAVTVYNPLGIARLAGKGQQAITSVLQPQEDSSNYVTRFFDNIDKNHSFKDEIALQQIAPIVPALMTDGLLSVGWIAGSASSLSATQPRSEYIANMGLILGTLGLGKIFGLGRDYASSQAGKVTSSVLNTGTTLAGATGNIYINDKMFKNEDGSWNVGKLFLGTGLDVVNLGTKELPHSLSLLFKGREPKTAYSFGVVDADTGQRHLFFEDPNSGFLTLQKVNEKLYNEVMEYNTKEGKPAFQQTVPSEAIKSIQLATNGKKNAFKKAFFGKDSETAEIVKSTPADYLEIDGNRVKVFNLEKALSENSVPKADVPDYEERADGVLTALQDGKENIKSMGGDKDFIRTIRQMREEDLISIKPNGDIESTAEGISRLEKNNTLRTEFKDNFEAELGKTASEVEGMTSDEVRNQPNEKETFAQKAVKEINYKKYFDNEGEPIKITALDYQKMGDGEKKIVRQAVVFGKLEQDKDGNIVNTSFKENYKDNSVLDFGRTKKSFAERELYRLGQELDNGNRKNIKTVADKLDLTNKEASSQAKKAFEFYTNQAKEHIKNVDSSIGEEYSIPMTLRGKEEPAQEIPAETPAPPKFPARVKTYGNTDFTKQAVGAMDFKQYTGEALPNRFVVRSGDGKIKVYSRISDTTFSREGSSTVHISKPVLRKMLTDEKVEIASGLSKDSQNQLELLSKQGNDNFSLIARHSKLGQDRYSPLNLDEKTQVVNDVNWYSGKDVVLEQHPDGDIKVNPTDERWNSSKPYFLADKNSVNVYVNRPMMTLVKKVLNGDKAVTNPAENFDVRQTQFLKDLTKNPDTSVFSANDVATAKSFSEFIGDRDQVNLVSVEPEKSYQMMRYKSIHEPTHQITNELGKGYAVKAIPSEMSNSLAELPEGQKFLEGVQKSTYAFRDENGNVKDAKDLSDTEKQISYHEIFTHATDQSFINNIGIKSAEDLDTFAKNYVNLFTALEKHHGTSVDNVLRFIDRNLLETINNEYERRNSFERLTNFENGGRGSIAQEGKTPNVTLAHGVGFTEGNGQKDFRGLRVKQISASGDFKFLIGKEDGTDPSPHKIDAQFNLADISSSPDYKGLFKQKSFDTLRTIIKMDGYDGYFYSNLDVPDHQRYEVTLFNTDQNKSKLGGIELAVKGTGEAFDEFFRNVSKGTDGTTKDVEYEPVLKLRPEDEPIVKSINKFSGNFENHIAKSIPSYKENQVKVATAITKLGSGEMLDIGGSEGSFAKSISSNSGIKTTVVDPNTEMSSYFKKNPVKGSSYIDRPYMSGWEGRPAWESEKKFDVVHESMVFQFVNNDRSSQIDHIVKNNLKPDGVLFVQEKFLEPEPKWSQNEKSKNDYKSRYFSKEAMSEKSRVVLEGMNKNMIPSSEMENILSDRFNYVYKYWDAGNFKGYFATNDINKARTISESIGNNTSEYSDSPTGFVNRGIELAVKAPVSKEGFYSPLEDAWKLESEKEKSKIPEKSTGEQYLNIIKGLRDSNGKGITKEEMDWSGISMLEPTKKYTKQEISDLISEQKVVVNETRLSQNEDFDELKIRRNKLQDDLVDETMKPDGGDKSLVKDIQYKLEKINAEIDNYKFDEPVRFSSGIFGQLNLGGKAKGIVELLFSIPNLAKGNTSGDVMPQGWKVKTTPKGYEVTNHEGTTVLAGMTSRKEAIDTSRYLALTTGYPHIPRIGAEYSEGHFSSIETNVFAHLRGNERQVEGKRAFHIEEVQSDLHQAGYNEGYQPEVQKQKAELNKRIQETLDESIKLKRDLKEKYPDIPWRDYNHTEYDTLMFYIQNGDVKVGFADKDEVIQAIQDVRSKVGELSAERYQLARKLDDMGEGIPDAPFKTTWHELTFKRALRYAVEKGMDMITWTTGSQQIERYGDVIRQNVDSIKFKKIKEEDVQAEKDIHIKRVEELTQELESLRARNREIEWEYNFADEYVSNTTRINNIKTKLYDLNKKIQEEVIPKIWISAEGKKGTSSYQFPVEGKTLIEGKQRSLEDVVGRDIAKKIREGGDVGEITGDDLSIGGQFHKFQYDQKIPRFAEKFIKPWGGKVEQTLLDTGREKNTFVPVDDKVFDTEEEANQHAFSLMKDPYELFNLGQKDGKWYVATLDWTPDPETVWKVDITPEMRTSVMDGLPLFAKVDEGQYKQQEAFESRKEELESIKSSNLVKDAYRTSPSDLSTEKVNTIINKGFFSLITPSSEGVSKKDVKVSLESIKKDLDDMGYSYVEAERNGDKGFMVYYPDQQTSRIIQYIGEKNNDTVIHGLGGKYYEEAQGYRYPVSLESKSVFDDKTASLQKDYAEQNGIQLNVNRDNLKLPTEAFFKKLSTEHSESVHSPDNVEVKKSYKSFISETKKQFDFLKKSNIKIEAFNGDGEPYKNSYEMMKDIASGHYYYLKSGDNYNKNHPLWENSGATDSNNRKLSNNDMFRIVHDLMGHSDNKWQFGIRGEFNTFATHSELYSTESLPALISETLMQNSVVADKNYSREGDSYKLKTNNIEFAEQKAIIPSKKTIDFVMKEIESQKLVNKDSVSVKTSDGGNRLNFNTNWDAPQKVETNLDNARLKLESRQNIKGNIVSNNDIRNAYRDGILEDAQGNKLDENTVFDRTGKKVGSVKYDEQGNAYVHFDNEKKNSETRVSLIDGVGKKGRDRFYVDKAGRDIIGALGTYQELVKLFNPQVTELKKPEQGASPQEIEAYNIKKNEIWLSSIDKHLQQWNDSPVKMWYDGVEDFAKKVGRDVKDVNNDIGKLWLFLNTAITSPNTTVPENTKYAMDVMATMVNAYEEGNFNIPRFQHDQEGHLIVSDFEKPKQYGLGSIQLEKTKLLSQGYVPANSIEGKAIVKTGGVVKRASELIPNSVKGDNLFVESPLAKQMMEKYGALQGILNYLMSPALSGKPNKALDLYGDKLGAFFSNLVGLTQIPTVDTWMNRHFKALTGEALQVERNGNGTITKIKDNTKNFNAKDGDEIRAVIQKATEDWNKKTGQKLTPADTQAIIWSSIKDTFNDFVAKTQKNVDFSEAYDQIRQRYEAEGKQPLQAPDERLDQPIVAPQLKELLDNDLKREMGDRWYLESKDGLELAVKNIPDVDLQNQKIDWSDPLLKACDKDAWVDIGTRLVSNNILANDEVRRIEHLADKGDFNGLQKYVLGLNRMGVLELFLNLTRIGLTFGVKNALKNIAGNGTRAFLDSVENVPLPILDFGMRLINKHILRGDNNEKASVSVLSNPISTAKIYGTSFAKVITEGLPEAWQTLKGENKDLVFEHPSLTRERTTGFGFLKPFEAFERFGWRFLGSQDKPWNVFAYHKAIGDFKAIRMEEQRQAGNNISWSDAEHYLTISDYQLAEISALDASYQGDNKLAGWYYGQVQKLPQFWRGIVTNIPKFVKTPLNVVDYMLDHTLIYPLAKLSYDKYNSKDFVDWKGTVKELFNNPQDRKLLSLMITKGAIGSIMLFAGFKMGQAGILNPFYQEKEKSEREQMQAKGTSYGSVEIGGKSVDISVFSPVSFYMLAGASMAKSSQEHTMEVEKYQRALDSATAIGDPDKIDKAQRELNEAQKKSPVSITASQIFKNWAEQTPFARQVSDVFDAQGKGNVFGVLEQWYDPTQVIPAIVKEVAEFRDPKKRVVDDSNYWTRSRDKVKMQIPTQRETLPVAYDMLGREIKQSMPYDVTKSKDISNEKLVNEMDRFNISIPFNEKGSSVEKNQMKGEKGRYFEPILQNLINSNEYNKSSDSIKQEMMRDTMYAVNREYSDKKLKPEEFTNNLNVIKSRNYYLGQLMENPEQFARKRQITDKDIVRDFVKAGVDPNIDIKGVLKQIPDLDGFLKEKFTHNFMIGKNLSLAEAQKNFKEFQDDPEKEIIKWWISEKEYKERSERLREKKEELIKQGKTDEEIKKILAKDSAKLGWERRKGKYGTVKSVNTSDTPKKFLDTGVTNGKPEAEPDILSVGGAGVDLPTTTPLDSKDTVLRDNLESTIHNSKADDLEKHLNKKFTSEEKAKIFKILSDNQANLAGAIKIYEAQFNKGQLNTDDIDWLQKTKAEKRKIDMLVERFASHPFANVRESQNVEDIR